MPVTFGFNRDTMEIYVYHYGTVNTYTTPQYRVVADLNSDDIGLRKIEDFNDYSITVTMTQIAEDKTANMIIYDINGQSLSGENIENDCGPVLSLRQSYNAVVNNKYLLECPNAFDLIDGKIDFAGTVEVYNSNNTKINVYNENGTAATTYSEGCYFTPATAGNYTIKYTGKDLDNVSGKVFEYKISALAQFPDAEYTINGNYRDITNLSSVGKNSAAYIFCIGIFIINA
jgi:hypothetical protein